MTAQDVIDEVREQLNDMSEQSDNYRFSDAEMLRAVTDANYQLAGDRKDLLLTAAGAYEVIVDITTTGQTLFFESNMRSALSHFVSQIILTKDSEDDQNMKLAGFHLNKYNSLI